MRVRAVIEAEAKRLIYRHETNGRLLAEEAARRAKRSTSPTTRPRLHRPEWWALDDGFNPYLTRARSERIAHSIRSSLSRRKYAPRKPVEYDIPKSNGDGTRPVCIYQVADGAISKMLYEGILKKNLSMLSARAYAYRKDVSAQDAIQYVRSSFLGANRMFIAEYDFKSYFETINHEHVLRTLKDHFLLTEVEYVAVKGFLSVAPSAPNGYSPTGGAPREAGIPQGTSISLLLANVAAWDLDRALETTGVGFTRYADDTLIWSTDYSRICEATELLHAHATAIGVAVNAEKSPGVRMLATNTDRTEMRSTESVPYLGYQVALDKVRIKPQAVERMREHIGSLLYWTLLHEPLRGTQHPDRITPVLDRDYVSYVWRIRGYLYGDLSERAVQRYQRRDTPLRRFKGVMAAYPLIDDSPELGNFDGWIANQTWLTLRRRTSLLTPALGTMPTPHGLDLASLLKLTVTSATTGETVDLRLPSVRRVARVITKAAALHGAGAVGSADPYA